MIVDKSEKYVKYKTRDPSFIKDILPYYHPIILFVGLHIVYFYTGNGLLPGWLVFIGTPLYNMLLLDDDHDV